MPVATSPGNVRLRAFNLGKETTFGTPVAATRRFPWPYAPVVDAHWTQVVADTGTLDYALNPYRAAGDYTGTATGPLAFDDAIYLWAALTKAGVTPSSHIWTFTPASTTLDNFEIFTGEWGDETADQYQFADGVLNDLQLTFPENLGPVEINAGWRFANVAYPHARTPGLQTDPVPAWIYAADTSYYINDTAGAIGTTQLVNGVHQAVVKIDNRLSVKRFQDGSNSRFAAAGYGRGLRTLTATFTLAKSTTALQEVADWLNADPVERFFSINTVSPQIIPTTSTPYSHELRFAGFWTANSPGTYATTNTTNQLVCEAFLDQTLGYPFSAIVTTKASSL